MGVPFCGGVVARLTDGSRFQMFAKMRVLQRKHPGLEVTPVTSAAIRQQLLGTPFVLPSLPVGADFGAMRFAYRGTELGYLAMVCTGGQDAAHVALFTSADTDPMDEKTFPLLYEIMHRLGFPRYAARARGHSFLVSVRGTGLLPDDIIPQIDD